MTRGRHISIAFRLTVGLFMGPLFGQGNLSAPNPEFVSSYLVNPFETLRPLMTLPQDTLSRIPRLLKSPYKITRTVNITSDWSLITLGETTDNQSFRMPFVAPLEWYMKRKFALTREKEFKKILAGKTQATTEQTAVKKRGQGIEVVGVDVDRLGRVSINARGNVSLKGKMVFQDQELVRSRINETQNTHLEFDQTQRISVEGKIGDRVTVKVDHDSERDFDWENNIRISYKGEEDDIIQTVDAGNVSLNLPGSQSLMGSAAHKGLFGIKTISKFGPVDVTAIASVVNAEKKSQEYEGKSEAKTYTIKDYSFLKNKYFFIHDWYRNGVNQMANGHQVFIPPFYPLQDGLHVIGNTIVRNFELYQLDQTTNSETNPGVARVDVTKEGSKDQSGLFKRLEQGQDYYISEDLGFIRLRQRAGEGDVLACTFVIAERSTGDTVLTVGQGISETSDQLILKMIKPLNLTPAHPVWPLMFKNVYYLGASNINKEGFDIRIVNDRLPVRSHLDPQGTPYITHFGLDSTDVNGNRQADQKIDLSNPNILNLADGELFIPWLYPFAADTASDGNPSSGLKGVLGEGKMYTSSQSNDWTGDSRFTLEVDYSNLSATINLGFMIVEGSEQVFKGGVPLTRSVDYQVDYFSGTIILNDDIDPNEKIRVVYDKHQLVSFDKKTILGVRSQMDFGENSFIGGTALYYNQSVINEKIEVGYEPMRNFIWGLNGRSENTISGLTRALDRLPLLETDTESKFSIEGEFAQILPNPNPINNTATGDPEGVAYIDDFEGSKRTTSVPIQRRFWKEASAPVDRITEKLFSQRSRAKLSWYNPFIQVRTKDIWPNLSTSIQAQNETTDILILKMNVRDHQDAIPKDSIWGGIVTPLYTGDYDQTQTKFFEIWIKGDTGTVTVDLGEISEDRDGNGVLNTEDIPVGGLIGDGILEDKEDIGLDGCPDEYEDGWGGCLDPDQTTYADLKSQGETVLINIHSDVDPEDPNGDNWSYSEGSFDFSKINGTEGNALDAGRYPDTEDLDRTGFLDRTNDYFTKSFSLKDTLYLDAETKKDGIPTGWRLFKIPLIEFDQSDPATQKQWTGIRHLRLTLSGVEETATVQVAKVELVGNEWQEMGIAADTSDVFVKNDADSIFAVTVINTDDDSDYRPPDGVRGEYDRINQIRSKEQSLILKYNGLPAHYAGAAMKTLLSLSGERAQSYLTYRRMKMYVYGKGEGVSYENSNIEMFMRFGFGDNFYEITQPVYEGWDQSLERNAVDIDLEWLSRLKLQDSTSVDKFNSTDIFVDSLSLKRYIFTDENGLPTGKKIRIKGQPALNRIQFFVVGVRNLSDLPVTGEVWLDELRLSGVNKDRGVSMRLQGKFNLADIANTSIVYRRQDADFHMLQKRLGSTKSSESINLNTGIRLDKFMPKDWGLNLPVNATYAGNFARPKYFPGQDIIVDPHSVPDSILAQSQTINFSVKASKSSKSDNRLVKYSLDKLNTSFSASRSLQSNEIQKEVLNESYSGGLSYALPFGRNNYWMPFKWMDGIPYIGRWFGKTHFYYSPTNINAGLTFNERLTKSTPRRGNPAPDNYNFGFNQSYTLDYKLTENLKSKVSRTVKSNLNEYRAYAWGAMKNFDPGVVEDIRENANLSYSPTLADWLKPTFNYSTNYSWNKDRSRTLAGANIGSQIRFTGGVSLSPVKLIELIYKPKGSSINKPVRSRPPARGRTRVPGREGRSEEGMSVPKSGTKPQEEEQSKIEEVGTRFRSSIILRKTHAWSKKINPINMSYSENINRTGMGVLGEVPLGYRLGWLHDHGLEHSDQAGSNTGNWDHKRDFSVRSGINFTRRISVSVNYAQNVSTNRRGSGVEQRALSRDYFSYGSYLNKGFPFVGWSVRWTGLERIKFFQKYVRTISLDHAATGKESRAWQFDQFDGPQMPFFGIGSFIEDYGEKERSARRNMNYAPLVGMTMALKNGVALTLRHNRTLSREESPNGGQKLFQDQSYTATANYTHRGGFTIPVPFFDNYKVQNQVNFTFNFDMNKNKTQQKALEATKFAETAFTSNWKAGIRVTYSFSATVSGSVIWEYRESDSKHTGKKIDRDFGFDVNLAIRG